MATWSVNDWGGRNRYRNHEGGPDHREKPSPVRRALGQALARVLPEIRRKRLSGSSVEMSRAQTGSPTHSHFTARDSGNANRRRCQRTASQPFGAARRRVLAWLDGEELAFECVADVDLDREPELAQGRQAIVLLGHSEYWSEGMFDAVRRPCWRLVVNLSGNTIAKFVWAPTIAFG